MTVAVLTGIVAGATVTVAGVAVSAAVVLVLAAYIAIIVAVANVMVTDILACEAVSNAVVVFIIAGGHCISFCS